MAPPTDPRSSYRLPDTAIVVRGGRLKESDLWRAAQRAEVRQGAPGLSVFAADVPTVDDVLRAAPDLRVYPWICHTTAERLRRSGFTFIATGRAPHFTVLLPQLDSRTLRVFAVAFGAPERNRYFVRAR